MPKTTTTDFDRQWADTRQRFAYYEIDYKRRYAGPAAYAWEASARTLTPYQIERISPIQWKSDEASGGEHLAANVSIFLRNDAQRWLPSNEIDGLWRADSVALSGYEPYLSWFQIKYGYRLSNGTFELLSVFTGYSEIPTFDSESGLVEIHLVGREIICDKKDAQQVSTSYTHKPTDPATGDGSNPNFSTGQKSVFEISEVRVDGVAQTQGTDGDYTIEYLNDADNEANIIFNAGSIPGAGLAVDWSGRQWKRNQQVSTLAGLLCDEAGVTAGERTIEEPTWPDVSSSVVVDSAADWAAATKSNTDSDTVPGSLILRWKLRATSIVHAAFSIQDILCDQAYGSWAFDMVRPASNVDIIFLNQTGGAYPSGYTLAFDSLANTTCLERWDAGYPTLLATVEASAPLSANYRITRSAAGEFNIYRDGVLKATVTDNTYTESIYFSVKYSVTITNLYTSNLVDPTSTPALTGTVLTAELDLLAAPIAWGKLIVNGELNYGTWSWKTQVASISGGPYDALVAVDTDGTILSALKRYLKIEGTLTGVYHFDSPQVDKLTANYYGSALFIVQGDFGSMSVYDALRELADFCGMDMGFLGDGSFFFLNKLVSTTADFTFNEKNALSRILIVDPGYKNVRNLIQVKYNNYYAEWNSVKEGESFPTSQDRYGDNIEPINLDSFAFSNNTQVAEAVARKHYQEKYAAKRLIKSSGRIIPQMNLRDVAEVSFVHTPLLRDVIYGDPMQTEPPIGDDAKGPSNVLLQKVTAKIVGISFDIMKSAQETDFLEVLS